MITYQIEIDFAGDGFGGPGSEDDLSARFLGGSLRLGITEPEALVAAPGRCTLTFDNADRCLSPEYVDGPYYGALRPGLALRVRATDGAQTWTLFHGRTTRWAPLSGEQRARTCTVEGADLLAQLARAHVSLPLRQRERGDQLVRHVLNIGLNAPAAAGTLRFAGSPQDGDSVTVNGARYTFRAALNPALPNQVQIGADHEQTADALAAAINGAAGAGAFYGSGTARPEAVTALPNATYVRLVRGDGAIRHYRLGENAGPQAADSGLNGQPACYHGGTLAVAGALSGDPDCAFGLDGAAAWLEIPALALDARAFSVEWWMKPVPKGAPPGYQVLFSAHESFAAGKSLSLRLYDDGRLAANIQPNSLITGAVRVPFGIWSHVAYTYEHSSGTSRLYVNGALAAQGAIGTFVGQPAYLAAGALHGTQDFLHGDLDELAIYLHTLDAAPISAHAAARAIVPGVTFRAALPGSVGNAFPLACEGAALAVSGPTLAGGLDQPDDTGTGTGWPAPYLEAGSQVFELAGDSWSNERSSALETLRQITESERGLCWLARDGRLHWHNASYLLRRVAQAVALTLNGEALAVGSTSDTPLANAVRVSTTPRAITEPGVVARSHAPLAIPGQSGTARYDPLLPLVNPGGGNRLLTLPFVDPSSGRAVGARDVVLPLVPGLDYTANDRPDGTGFDYTYSDSLSFSAAVTASEVQISVRNTALGPLYLTMLQVRGRLITAYDPVQVALDDPESQAVFGTRALTLNLPLPVNPAFLESVAAYLLAQRKAPAYTLERLEALPPVLDVGDGVGQHVFATEIGDVLAVSEAPTGLEAVKVAVLGLEYTLASGGPVRSVFHVRRLDNQTFWILGDARYGALESTARLGI